MKFLILLLSCVLCLSELSHAQNVNQINIDQNDLDQLIIAAIRNSNELDEQAINLETMDHETKLVTNQHLGLFFAAGNLNEYSIQELSGNSSIPNFYPRYNFGVNVKFNHFSNVQNQKKIIDQNKKLILNTAEQIERALIEQITKKYITYLQLKELLLINKKLNQFGQADFNTVEQKFSEGEVDLEKYNNARKVQFGTKINLINAESAYITAKTELESLVGESLISLGLE